MNTETAALCDRCKAVQALLNELVTVGARSFDAIAGAPGTPLVVTVMTCCGVHVAGTSEDLGTAAVLLERGAENLRAVADKGSTRQ